MSDRSNLREPIYLGKMGKAFGPYSEAQLQQLKASGSLREFSWIWDAQQQSWAPLDPPPAPLTQSQFNAASPAERTLFRHDSILPLEAICHNRRSAITARLRLVSETGCELISPLEEEPPFPANCQVALNLLDPRTGKSVELPVRLAGLGRSGGAWRYRVLWESCPPLVLESIA